MHRVQSFRFLITLALFSIVMAACSSGAGDESEDVPDVMEEMGDVGEQTSGMDMPDLPDDLYTSTSKETDIGLFVASISSELDPLAINQIHSWIVHIETSDGAPVENAEIKIGGGMPQHNHGFPTSPAVTQDLGGGDYLIEGVKFNMGGWWELQISISTGDESDSVTFNLILPQ